MKNCVAALVVVLSLCLPAFGQTETPTSTPTATPTQTPTSTPTRTPTNTPARGSDCCDCGFGVCTEPLNIEGNCPAGCVGVYGAACLPSGCATFTPTLGPQGTHTPIPATSTPVPSSTPAPPSATPTNTPSNTPAATPICAHAPTSSSPQYVRMTSVASATPVALVDDPNSDTNFVVPFKTWLHTSGAATVSIGNVTRVYGAAAHDLIEWGPSCQSAQGSAPLVTRSSGSATVTLITAYSIE